MIIFKCMIISFLLIARGLQWKKEQASTRFDEAIKTATEENVKAAFAQFNPNGEAVHGQKVVLYCPTSAKAADMELKVKKETKLENLRLTAHKDDRMIASNLFYEPDKKAVYMYVTTGTPGQIPVS